LDVLGSCWGDEAASSADEEAMIDVTVLHLDRFATLMQGRHESNRRMAGWVDGKGAEASVCSFQ
jgi:hypothetical protein